MPESGVHSSDQGHRPFLLLLVLFSLFLSFWILRPFFHTIVLAIIIAAVFHRLQGRVVRWYGGRKNAAALTVLALVACLIIFPILFFLSELAVQGFAFFQKASEWIGKGNLETLMARPETQSVIQWFREHLEIIAFAKTDIQGYLLQLSRSFGQFVLKHGAGLLQNIAGLIFHLAVMLFLTFYMIRDGQDMLAQAKYLFPLRGEQKDRVIDRIRITGRSVLLGSLLTAVCQGAVGGIGLAIVGIPGLIWGTVLGFTSLIPIVGTSLVWIPSLGYLALMGQWKRAVFLALWAIFLVGTIDNFLRPFFMGGKGRMSTFYVFLSLIGGIHVFGLPGILYGPLILAFANVMLYIYRVEYQGKEPAEASPP